MKVTLIAVVSIDGFITRHRFPGTGFASKADHAFYRAVLAQFDCSILGANTYRHSRQYILAHLDEKRLRVVMTREPEKFAAERFPNKIEFSKASPSVILEDLRTRGYVNCALLGGGEINALFMKEGLIDAWWVTLEPRLFGSGLPLCPGKWDYALKLDSVSSLGNNALLLKYDRKVR